MRGEGERERRGWEERGRGEREREGERERGTKGCMSETDSKRVR